MIATNYQKKPTHILNHIFYHQHSVLKIELLYMHLMHTIREDPH